MLAEQMLKPVNDMMSKMMQMFKKPVDLGIGAPEDALGIVPRLPPLYFCNILSRVFPQCIFVTSCVQTLPMSSLNRWLL
jgi:hypothetical protein